MTASVQCKRFIWSWPRPMVIQRLLITQQAKFTVGIDTLAPAGNWSRSSRTAFLKHYRRYQFLKKKPIPTPNLTLSDAVEILKLEIQQSNLNRETSSAESNGSEKFSRHLNLNMHWHQEIS